MNQSTAPADLIRKYYSDYPEAHRILLSHSRKVTKKALAIGRQMKNEGHDVDLRFLAEAAMLHDIGMILTDTPDLGCHGSGPYLQHGIKGGDLLRREGLPRHADVCERHIGVGLSATEIAEKKLPLPQRDMYPISLEEQIICYADLFYSKNRTKRDIEQTPRAVRKKLLKFGEHKALVFDRWQALFEPETLKP